MLPHLKGFSLQKWIDENRGNWGQRRVIWQDSDFIAFVTRGPNQRKDYHINPGDEIFYQLEGELNLHYLKEDKHDRRRARRRRFVSFAGEGSAFAAAAADGSWTFVIERRRGKEEIDRFIWPCENCGNNLYETRSSFRRSRRCRQSGNELLEERRRVSDV